jgi:hypothetical protein
VAFSIAPSMTVTATASVLEAPAALLPPSPPLGPRNAGFFSSFIGENPYLSTT